MAETKTAAYICTGCGIGDKLDAARLAKVAKREGKMALVREHRLRQEAALEAEKAVLDKKEAANDHLV